MKRVAKKLGIKWQPSWSKDNGFQDIKAIPKGIRKILLEEAKKETVACKRVKIESKGKYILLLGKNSREQRELNKSKTWKPHVYPKRT